MFNGSVPLWHIPAWRTGWRPSKNKRRVLPKAKHFEPELNLPKVMKAAWRKRRKPLYVAHSYFLHSEEGKQEYTHPSGTIYIYIHTHIPQNLRLSLSLSPSSAHCPSSFPGKSRLQIAGLLLQCLCKDCYWTAVSQPVLVIVKVLYCQREAICHLSVHSCSCPPVRAPDLAKAWSICFWL